MPYRFLLAISMLLNCFLLLTRMQATPGSELRVSNSRTAPEGTVISRTTQSDQLFHFRGAIDHLDHGQIENAMIELRRSGLPDPMVHDLILGAVNRRYAARILNLRRTPVPFWQPLQRRKQDESDPGLERERQARTLESERNQITRSLLGIDWATVESEVTGRPDSFEQLTDSFAPRSRPRARQILAQYDQRERDIIQGAGGTLGQPEKAALHRLYQEKLDELRQFLSPPEIEEYELRTSWTAEHLKQFGLVGFEPAEDEFRTIFRLRKVVDERENDADSNPSKSGSREAIWQAHDELEEQLRVALGPARYAEYQRSQDYTFRGLVELAGEYDLPTEAAVGVYNLRESALQRTRELQQNSSITDGQRQTFLTQVRADTEQVVQALLGDPGFRRYTQLEIGSWIAELNQR